MRTPIALLLSLASLPAFAQQKPISLDDAGFAKTIATHKGKVVLASFWATWCVPCRKEMPDLVKLSQKLSARGFDLVMISADEPDRAAAVVKTLEDNKVPGPVYWLRSANPDKFYSSLDAKWADGALPALFLYDRAGKKTRAFVGETSVHDLEAAILKLLS